MAYLISFFHRIARVSTILLAAGFCLLGADVVRADAVAKQVSGLVEIGRGEPPLWRAVVSGETIEPDDRIRTGADGRVEITMGAGTLRVHENSLLRLPPPSAQADRVDLEKGNSLFDVLRRAGRRFEVHTPTVVVSVKGTRFGVDATGEIGAVSVYRGVVGVREAGVNVAMETLVREGFLATGGAGSPIELDVAPAGDPWASWQDFRREVGERHAVPSRMNDIDQAKNILHRATTEAVIERAAERKPEVAERLRQLKRERSAQTPRAKPDEAPGSSAEPAVPAAPMLSNPAGSGAPGKQRMMHDVMHDNGQQSMRDQLRQKREAAIQENMQQKAMMNNVMSTEDMTGTIPFTNGQTGFSSEAMQGLSGQELIDVLQARDEVWSVYVASGASAPGAPPWTPGQFMQELRTALISQGYDPLSADALVNQLTGN